jgi:hypothetical protein
MLVVAVLAAAALRRIELLINRADDVGDPYLIERPGNAVTATRPRTLSTSLCRRSLPNNCSR